MGGVDNMDKDKKIGGSFMSRALFRKWYCMGLMQIFDQWKTGVEYVNYYEDGTFQIG